MQMRGRCPWRCVELRHPDGSYECACEQNATTTLSSKGSSTQMEGGCPPRCFKILHPDGSYECDCNEVAATQMEGGCPPRCFKILHPDGSYECDCNEVAAKQLLEHHASHGFLAANFNDSASKMQGFCPGHCIKIRNADGSYECDCDFKDEDHLEDDFIVHSKLICPPGCREVMTDPPTCYCPHIEEQPGDSLVDGGVEDNSRLSDNGSGCPPPCMEIVHPNGSHQCVGCDELMPTDAQDDDSVLHSQSYCPPHCVAKLVVGELVCYCSHDEQAQVTLSASMESVVGEGAEENASRCDPDCELAGCRCEGPLKCVCPPRAGVQGEQSALPMVEPSKQQVVGNQSADKPSTETWKEGAGLNSSVCPPDCYLMHTDPPMCRCPPHAGADQVEQSALPGWCPGYCTWDGSGCINCHPHDNIELAQLDSDLHSNTLAADSTGLGDTEDNSGDRVCPCGYIGGDCRPCDSAGSKSLDSEVYCRCGGVACVPCPPADLKSLGSAVEVVCKCGGVWPRCLPCVSANTSIDRVCPCGFIGHGDCRPCDSADSVSMLV